MRKCILYILLSLITAVAFAQEMLENGDYIVRIPNDSPWQKLIRFSKNGDTCYVLDISNKVVRTYNTPIDQPVFDEFSQRCDSYTYYEIWPDGTSGVTTYRNGRINGYRRWVDRYTTDEGTMVDYQRVGMWKYTNNISGKSSFRYHLFKGESEKDALSIPYHMVLFPLLIITLLATAIIRSRRGKYAKVYYNTWIIAGLSLLAYVFLKTLKNSPPEYEPGYIQMHDAIVFTGGLLAFSLLSLLILSCYNLFSQKHIGTIRIMSIIFVVLFVLSILSVLVAPLFLLLFGGKIGG
jgi:hypothetical protein